MRPTKTLIGEKARKAVWEGVNSIYQPVRMTFGPQGKNALLYRTWGRGPRITNDGYTVAETQEPKDPFVRLAANAFKEICKRTNEKVGDGTTGTAILGGHLFNEVYRMYTPTTTIITSKKGGESKMGVMTIRKQILEAAAKVKEEIRQKAKNVESVEDLEKIATISVEDPELGKLIAKTAYEVGKDGFIDVVEGYKGTIEVEVIKGSRFPAKVPAKAFVNNPDKYEMVVEDCEIVITNYAIDNPQDIVNFVQHLHVSKLTIIAPSFSDNVLIALVASKKNGGVFVYPVAAPSLRTEQFEDLAIYMGATFVDKAKGMKLDNIRDNDLGFVEKLTVKETDVKDDATALGGKGTKMMVLNPDGTSESIVTKRLKILEGQLKEIRQEQFKILMQRRIASLASAGGAIRVGDSTQASALYMKLKIEDAVNACKAALRGGYVPGAGICLKEISESLPEGNILKASLLAPYEQIQASVEGGIEIGPDIIDPAEAIYCAVDHATSAVANLITVEILTPEMDEPAPGEGEFAIAKALNVLAVNDKIHKGQLQESGREAELDKLNGLNEEEYIYLNENK